MMGSAGPIASPVASPVQAVSQPQANSVVSGKPVVGFLYSVSRTAAGEFWPLHIGPNTIGQNPSCDVFLPEGTVSGDHAVIVVRKLKKTESSEKIIASISDARSTNGTMVNGISLGFSAEKCRNGDIITIGDNYELLLVLIDTEAIGLEVNQDFMEIASIDESEDEFEDDIPDAQMPPYGEQFYQPYGDLSGGTVGIDGSHSSHKGGTVGM